MNRRIVLFCLLTAFVAVSSAKPLRVGTYNLRIQTNRDEGDKNWDNRKTFVARTITDNRYDVIGFQEIANAQQENDLRTLLPDYTLVAYGRNSAERSEGERVGVAFCNKRFELLNKGYFFLTENPDVPGLAWDASYKRVAVYVLLRDKQSGQQICYCSTHLDYLGKVARRNGAALVCQRILAVAGNAPAFIVGDLNAEPQETDVHRIFAADFADSREVSKQKPTGYSGTFCDWKNKPTQQRIDYIYVRKATVKSYKTIHNDYGRSVLPSDHIAVQATVQLQK